MLFVTPYPDMPMYKYIVKMQIHKSMFDAVCSVKSLLEFKYTKNDKLFIPLGAA